MTHVQADISRRSFAGAQTVSRRVQLFAGALLVLVTFAVVAVPRAGAVSDAEELTRFGSSVGSAAGQLSFPFGTASDPTTGHVYVTDNSNNRIDEFTPWGKFVKAFGWDVAPGAVNEQQEVRVRAGAGQFKLSFEGEKTPDLAFDAPGSASEGPGSVEAALDALPSIASGGGSVSVEEVTGTPSGKTPYIYVVAFKGSLAGTDVAQLTATNGTTPLGGGNPSTTLEVRTRADGTPGGTGLESCTAESGCKAGPQGNGNRPGEFDGASGVAVDVAGDIYVGESISEEAGSITYLNHRVQKFDPAGRFLLMFGGGVDQGPHHPGNLCSAANIAEGDTCGGGSEGTGPGEFAYGNSIALGADGTVFVADKERIEEFEPNGAYKGEVKVPGETVTQLAVNPKSGGFYVVFESKAEFRPPKDNVQELDPTTGATIGQLEVKKPGALATDSAGNVYVVEQTRTLLGGVQSTEQVLEFDSSGKQLSPPSCCVPPPVPHPGEPGQHFNISSLSTNAEGDLYVANVSARTNENFIRLFGPAPVAFEAPPKVPPTIVTQFASSVERDGAVLGAEINPHFWSDARYYVQYGPGKCSEGGCEESKPVPPGAILTPKVIDAPLKSAGIFLEGLQPGTTYHYRFVAQSSGGGPVRGIGGEVGIDGEESTFTTYPAPALSKSDCPNQAFRTGFSTPLPDCRAFEMVSPLDKDNGDVKALLDFLNYTTALDQSSTSGEKFTYTSYRAFANPEAAPFAVQYLASREDGVGWSNEAIAPPQGPVTNEISVISANLENEYKAFSADLCSGWLVLAAEPLLAPTANDGHAELYRRDNCGGEGYEALIGVEPSSTPGHFNPEPQGASTDGKKAVFRANEKLTPDAASGDVSETYYSSGGELNLICILPSGVPSPDDCSAGTDPVLEGGIANSELNHLASVNHAISSDGSRVYWTASTVKSGFQAGTGKVYLRENPDQEQSEISGGECTEVEKACTIKVSETVSTKAARFLGANPDGSKALFEVTEGVSAGNLYEFELEAGESTLIAKKSLGLAGASEDLSYLYFVSTEASAEAIAAGAVKGRPNLYLAHEGASSFIASLSAADSDAQAAFGSGLPTDVSPEPIFHAARVSADGSHVAFISTEPLAGYDNVDQTSGGADSEVYVYEAGAPGPVCVSCNPSGARPAGRGVRLYSNSVSSLPTAGSIPVAQSQLYFSHALSANGQRLFFDSYDALLPRDTNGKEDVYEWEAASSSKDCEEKGADIYVPSSGGCLSLLSSGESPKDSEFLDASPDGHDAFFTTNASLLPQDPGLIDVYNAREGGGLPPPPAPPAPCQGEACQEAPGAPNDPTPASASFKGTGNAKPAPRCAKGKFARKGRCVAKKHKRAKKRSHKRDTNHKGRAAR